jgi:uncharacterized protein DUF5818
MKRLILSVAGAFLVFTAVPQFVLATPQRTETQQNTQAQSKTFTGTIMKKGDNFVLRDSSSRTSYTLDDAQRVSEFEGKKVKVTGTIDTASNMIHVEAIEEVA